MFLGIQKNSRGAEGKNKKTPDPFSDVFSDVSPTSTSSSFVAVSSNGAYSGSIRCCRYMDQPWLSVTYFVLPFITLHEACGAQGSPSPLLLQRLSSPADLGGTP